VKTDVATAITAAEIQSPDPESLAKRWSAITDIALQKGDTGHPELPLRNALIRFVEPTDGRGEGLGAIDIKANDPQRLLQSADQRGLKNSETRVSICGLRVNLV
jgi:hypothetical protein